MPITEIIDNQMPSLTEWLEKINFVQTEEFRQEDNTKKLACNMIAPPDLWLKI